MRKPPQKLFLASMELCYRRLGLNAVDSCKLFHEAMVHMVVVLLLRLLHKITHGVATIDPSVTVH